VDAIETLYAHRVTEFVEQLAYHAFRGEAWEKAVSCLREATRRAMARAAYREAVAFGEQALAALGHLPQTPHIVGHAIDIRFQIRVPLMALADIRRLHEHLSLAEALADRLEDHRRLVKIIAYKTHYFWLVGQYEQALETGVKALALATSLGDSRVEAEAILNLGATYYFIGDYRKAIAVLRRISTPSMTDADNEQRLVRPRVTSRGFLAISAMAIGDFSLAITMAEEALRLAETSQDFFALIHGLFYIGGVHTTQGAFDLAIPKLERALRIADGREMPGQSYIVASFLGHAYAHAGHLETALPILDRAVREASELGSAANSYPPLAPYIAAGYLLVGRRDLASGTARLGLQLSRERKERGSQADNLRVLGEIASGSDDPERKRAEDHYCSALALGTELGMRPLVAHCHLGLGKLYWRTGKREQAQERLTTATTMYREMGMTYWLEKTTQFETT
jgi:tetratricopeptide (TPR) repeat protein